MIYDSILGTIGRTPVVRINRIAPQGVTMYVKCEVFNPLSSVKDRLAIAIIEDAERRGTLKPGQTVVEATSGNTGIALAMVCAAKGYPFVAIMADSFSVERRKMMRMLGAKVILTPAAERGTGMVQEGRGSSRRKTAGSWRGSSRTRPIPTYHRNTTGPGDPPRLRRQAARLLRHGLGHRRHADGRGRDDQAGAARDRRSSSPSPRRRAPLRSRVEAAQDPGLDAGLRPGRAQPQGRRRDRDRHRRRGARRRAELAEKEGIFCGISSGGTFAAARKVARKAPKGIVILAMLPDTGERYLSTILFEGINEGSDEVPGV